MVDMTMCWGERCEKRDTCYRHNAPPDRYMQTYFAEPPQAEDGGCEYFIEDVRGTGKKEKKEGA